MFYLYIIEFALMFVAAKGVKMPQDRPFDLLNKSIGQQVMIRLKNGTDIRGRVVSFDAHMNIVIENAEEVNSGELKAKLNTILLRGGNILFISPV